MRDNVVNIFVSNLLAHSVDKAKAKNIVRCFLISSPHDFSLEVYSAILASQDKKLNIVKFVFKELIDEFKNINPSLSNDLTSLLNKEKANGCVLFSVDAKAIPYTGMFTVIFSQIESDGSLVDKNKALCGELRFRLLYHNYAKWIETEGGIPNFSRTSGLLTHEEYMVFRPFTFRVPKNTIDLVKEELKQK